MTGLPYAAQQIINWDVIITGLVDGDNTRLETIMAGLATVWGDATAEAASTYAVNTADAIRQQRQFREQCTMQRTYHIELHCEFTNPEIYTIIEQQIREAAQGVAAFATILADGRRPHVGVRYDDRFEGSVEIPIVASQAVANDDT